MNNFTVDSQMSVPVQTTTQRDLGSQSVKSSPAQEHKPPRIRIKNRQEALGAILTDQLADRGFLTRSATALAVLGTLAASIVSWKWVLLPLTLLAVDYAWFIARRARILKSYLRGVPRSTTPADFRAVSDAYDQAGTPEPSMSDWNEAAGYSKVPRWREALRYQTAAAFYTGGTVLDVGCGDGRLCWRYGIRDPQNYIGVDTARDLLRTLSAKTSDKATAIEAVAEDLPVPPESADLIICSECFEHLPEPSLALQEFNRVLKPSGRIVIQSPNALRLRNLNPFHVLSLLIGYFYPIVLLRQIVHENTFVEAFTYHWDFTRNDFETYLRLCEGLVIETLHTGPRIASILAARGSINCCFSSSV